MFSRGCCCVVLRGRDCSTCSLEGCFQGVVVVLRGRNCSVYSLEGCFQGVVAVLCYVVGTAVCIA